MLITRPVSKRIIDMLATRAMTAKEVAELVEFTYAAAKAQLWEMEAAGIVDGHGSTIGGRGKKAIVYRLKTTEEQPQIEAMVLAFITRPRGSTRNGLAKRPPREPDAPTSRSLNHMEGHNKELERMLRSRRMAA